MKQEIKSDEFLLKIIHDLKTPTLAQIKALELFLVTTGKKINQEERELIELTLNSCNYMQKLIETFGAVHKLNQEQMKLNYEKFDFVELTKNILAELSILIKYHSLTVELECDDELIIKADKLQLRRVMENIISNALNHAYCDSIIYINIKKYKDNLFFEVKNNGRYIEPAMLEDIFEKYKTYSKLGMGLGLYLSKEIIHAHFGKMIARSSIDGANIFGFCIPV